MSKNKNLSGGLFAAKPTPLTIKETPLSATIVDYLNARNIYNDRLQCGQFQTPSGNWMRGSRAGTPDRFAIIRGHIIFIEVKRHSIKPTFNQMKRHEELREHGAVVVVVDSMESFIKQFEAIRAAIEYKARTHNLYD